MTMLANQTCRLRLARKRQPFALSFIVVAIVVCLFRVADVDDRVEFFEKTIRPVLVDLCYECDDSAKVAESSLAIDHRTGTLQGGDGGAIIVPGMEIGEY